LFNTLLAALSYYFLAEKFIDRNGLTPYIDIQVQLGA